LHEPEQENDEQVTGYEHKESEPARSNDEYRDGENHSHRESPGDANRRRRRPSAVPDRTIAGVV
jgi:hypothetical protein